MGYRFSMLELSDRAGELRQLAGTISDVRYRILTLLSYCGRSSAATAALAKVAGEIENRAADLDARAVFLEELNPIGALHTHPLRQLISTRADPPAVDAAVSAIRRALDESWFGDVSRRELFEIQRVLAGLDGPTFDAVIAELFDDELYRWFHALDGIRGGSVGKSEEAELFTMLARQGSAATTWRLAQAERGTRLHQLTAAITAHPDPVTRLDFLLLVAADAGNADHALAALAVLDSLDPAWQRIAAVSLGADALATLSETLNQHLRSLTTGRDDPIPVEFLEGVGKGVAGIVTGIGGLTVQGLWDRHALRENWSGLGGTVTMLFRDPGQVLAAIADLEGLRNNPTLWAGSLAPDVAAALLTGGTAAAAARTGKLGAAAQRLVTKLDELPGVVWADELGAIGPLGTGVADASAGLQSLFATGSVRNRTIASIRADLLAGAFTQGVAERGMGYLFRSPHGEVVRIMHRDGGWDIRIQNRHGNYLDEFGNVGTRTTSHSIGVRP